MIDWYFDIAFKKSAKEGGVLASQEKKEIAKEILPIIKIIPDQIEQAHYVNLLSKRLEVNEDVIFSAITRIKESKEKNSPKETSQKKLSSEQLLIAILLYRPAKLKQVVDKIGSDAIKDANLGKIYRELVLVYNKGGKIEKNLFDADRELKNTVAALLMIAEDLYKDDQGTVDEDLRELLEHFSTVKREALKTYYAREIKKAEQSRNMGKLKKLIEEFQNAIR